MLDELQEYQEYTYDLEEKDMPVRLKHSTLITGKNGGLARALTIIARHFLFENFLNEPDYVVKTKTVLKQWLGQTTVDKGFTGEEARLYNWLPEYIVRKLLFPQIHDLKEALELCPLSKTEKEMMTNCVTAILYSDSLAEKKRTAEILESKRELLGEKDKGICNAILNIVGYLDILSKRSFDTSVYSVSSENDIHLIRLDNVIANAIHAGKLRRYYLAFDETHLSHVEKTRGKISANDRDVIYKMTACCVLAMSDRGKKKIVRTTSQYINGADFCNWLIIKKCGREKLLTYQYKNMPLFEHTSLAGYQQIGMEKRQNIKKIRLCQEWFTDGGFEILRDENDINIYLKNHPKGKVFADCGAGKALKDFKELKRE